MDIHPPYFDEFEAQNIYHGNNNLLKLYETNMFSTLFIIQEQHTSEGLIGDNNKTYNIKAPVRNDILKLQYYTNSKNATPTHDELKIVIDKNIEIYEINVDLLYQIVEFIKAHDYQFDIVTLSVFDKSHPRPDIRTLNTLYQFIYYLFYRYVNDIQLFIDKLNMQIKKYNNITT